MLPAVILKKGEDGRIRQGHPWIFDNEIQEIGGEISPGGIVDAFATNGDLLGQGYINPASKIRVRLLTHKERFTHGITIEKDFEKLFSLRLRDAIKRRVPVIADRGSYRLIFSEGDYLPGLMVDKYDSLLIIQMLTLGMEIRKEAICRIIDTHVHPCFIYEKSDSSSRRLEGLHKVTGYVKEAGARPSSFLIKENDVSYEINPEGQKTGFYLDQTRNRSKVKAYAPGARVLDCFCYTGGFGLCAAAHGAQEVLGLDSSASAIETARKNAQLNHLTNIQFEVKDIFDALREKKRSSQVYDMVILDPPAFAKQKKEVLGARKGYKDINLLAMKIIRRDGVLITCSCSHYVSQDLMKKIIQAAAREAGRKYTILEWLGQDKDHPILPHVPETSYLKCAIVRIH